MRFSSFVEYFIDELNDLRKLMTEEYSGLYYTDAYAFSRIASITSEKHVCQVNFNLTSIKKGIEDLTQMKSPASISMTGVATSALEKVTINIKGEVLPQYLDKNETKLNVFVVEDNVTIDGYSIRNLARSMETPLWGDDISFDGNTFEKSYTISLDNCENKEIGRAHV